jgi:hypothetical protein
MRVMVFAKATQDSEKGAAPTAETLEAFAAMDRFIEELVKAGVFIAGAGLKNSVGGISTRQIRSIPSSNRFIPGTLV